MGEGEPEVEVEASTFELFRSFGGRRSEAQIRALPWTGDPGPYLAMLDAGPVFACAPNRSSSNAPSRSTTGSPMSAPISPNIVT